MNAKEITIEIHSIPDNEGRQSFSIHWHSDQLGYKRNEVGFAGQQFFGLLQPRLDKYKAGGKIVTIINKH